MKNLETLTVFAYNHFVINKNLEDINHSESLIEPSEYSNSINWILGHIVNTRDSLLEILSMKKLLDDKYVEIYKTGSQNLNTEKVLDTNVLIRIYNEAHEIIKEKLKEYEMKGNDDIDRISGLAFHEAYHAGQIGYIRKLLGKGSKI